MVVNGILFGVLTPLASAPPSSRLNHGRLSEEGVSPPSRLNHGRLSEEGVSPSSRLNHGRLSEEGVFGDANVDSLQWTVFWGESRGRGSKMSGPPPPPPLKFEKCPIYLGFSKIYLGFSCYGALFNLDPPPPHTHTQLIRKAGSAPEYY